MNCDNEKIWFHDIKQLACSTSIFPTHEDNLNQRFNSITRLSL